MNTIYVTFIIIIVFFFFFEYFDEFGHFLFKIAENGKNALYNLTKRCKMLTD